MKTNLKFSIIGIAFFFIACSNGGTDDQIKEAIIKVELINNDKYVDFEESLSFQIIAENASTLNLSGEVWDDVQSPDNLAIWFSKYGEINSISRTFITSEKVSSLTISNVLTPKTIDFDNKDVFETTIKIYADNKLVKTVIFKSYYSQSNTYSIPITISNL